MREHDHLMLCSINYSRTIYVSVRCVHTVHANLSRFSSVLIAYFLLSSARTAPIFFIVGCLLFTLHSGATFKQSTRAPVAFLSYAEVHRIIMCILKCEPKLSWLTHDTIRNAKQIGVNSLGENCTYHLMVRSMQVVAVHTHTLRIYVRLNLAIHFYCIFMVLLVLESAFYCEDIFSNAPFNGICVAVQRTSRMRYRKRWKCIHYNRWCGWNKWSMLFTVW